MAGLAFRRTRRAVALALLIPALADLMKDSKKLQDDADLRPWTYVALHVADDAAYGAGVWLGCAHERTVAPLVPRLSFRARVWSAQSLRQSLSGQRQTAGNPESRTTRG
jgi:hypothetical protein